MIKKLFSIFFSLAFGMAFVFFAWFSLKGASLELVPAILLSALVFLATALPSWVIFTFFFGYEQKPDYWKSYEAEGKPYKTKVKNLGLLQFILVIAGIYLVFSLLVDLILGSPLGDTLMHTFVRRRDYQPEKIAIFWDIRYPFLYVSFYAGLVGSAILNLFVYKTPDGEPEEGKWNM